MLQRHEMGERNYGAVGFLHNNTYEMMCEELIDLANYAMYTFIKIKLMEERDAGRTNSSI